MYDGLRRCLTEGLAEHLNGSIPAVFHIDRGEQEFLAGMPWYKAMALKGMSNFWILPLEMTTAKRLPASERKWINVFGTKVYNQRDTQQHWHVRLKIFQRSGVSTEVFQNEWVKA